MDHAVILVCTYIKAVANSVILQLYFDMIILKILKSNIYYIASRSAPPTSKVKNPGCLPVIGHVGTDDSEQHSASFFRVDVGKCEKVISLCWQ